MRCRRCGTRPRGCGPRLPGPRRTCTAACRRLRTRCFRRGAKPAGSAMPSSRPRRHRQLGDSARARVASTTRSRCASGTRRPGRGARSPRGRAGCARSRAVRHRAHARRPPARHPRLVDRVRQRGASATSGEHRDDRVVPAEHRGGITPPRRALLFSERGACLRWRVSVRAGEQRVCSAKSGVRPCSSANSAPVPGAVIDLAAASTRTAPAGIHADDLAHRPLAAVVRTLGEPHPEPRVRQRLEPSVVPLGRGDGRRCSGRPSSASHRPSLVCTLFEIATCVCRSGSPARESRCVNATASSPLVSTWRAPL